MNKYIKKTFSLILSLGIILSLFSGCSSSGDEIDFIYPFSGEINSFDPQVASTSDEFLVIENCFEGLVRVNDDGSVKPGVAKSWKISDDGKTYTFTLRQGAKWNIQSDDTENPTAAQELMGTDFNPDITAHDFVFALQRAADKTTDCPLFASISGIVNASEIHSGKKDKSKLGVTAIDDYTLEIKLNSADDSFLNTLSTAACMPCNEEYFNATKGRYGLGLDYSIFNGQFCVSNILEASYILDNNSLYVGDYPSKVDNITLKITDGTEDTAKNLKSGYYDAAYISGEEYEELKNSKITATSYTDAVLAMVLNKNSTIFANDKLRKAVCLSISDASSNDTDYLETASNLIPPSCLIGSDPAGDVIGKTVYTQDKTSAVKLWREGLNELGADEADFTVITTEEYEDITKNLVQGIQAGIGRISSYGDDNEYKISFSLKVSVLSEEDYQSALSSGEYDIALCKFEASSQNPLSFIDELLDDNYLGEIEDAQKALKNAQSASADELADAVKSCEEAILDDYSIKPVLFESSYYAQAKGVSGVQFHPGSGRICFVYANRED